MNQKLHSILQQMTLDQKIGQLTQYTAALFSDAGAIVTGPEAQYGLTSENLASVGSVLSCPTLESMLKIQQEHLKNDPNKIPIIFMMDVIHGYRTIYPIPLALAASFNPKLAKKCSEMSAKESAAAGIHVTFTPMVDYVRDARWGRVMESGGEEPLLTAAMAKAQIEGFEGESLADTDHIATCVKHFAGYGAAGAGRDYNQAELSLRELYQYYLPAYKACLDAGTKLLMTSFNSLNGVPSVANSFLMQNVLKDEWHYDGAVISDYSALEELISHGVAENQKDAARKAFACGCDIEMCSSAYFHCLKELIEEGAFTEAQIDEAVYRVLELKDRLGLFEDPYRGADQAKLDKLCLSAEHRRIAEETAEECAVLLKNDGVLPLNKNLKSIALIGPFADSGAILGGWSCNGREEDCVTVAQGVKNLLGDMAVSVCRGCSAEWDDTDESDISAAVEAAKQAEAVVLCLGEPQSYSGEGKCRTSLCLPGMQLKLAREVIQANPRAAVVLFNGRPLAIPELNTVAPAILDMFFPGTEGGNAVAALLFGDANPSGKLPMSFPLSVGQCPIYYNRTNTGRPSWHSIRREAPYRSNYIDCDNLPLYSFGHGLSYSDFIYEDATLSRKTLDKDGSIELTVGLRNNSPIPGKEVVQVYMRDTVASVVRPVQQLIAFEKVRFNAYESKKVCFTLTDEMFRFYNMKGELIREPGKILLMIGCADSFSLYAEIEVM